MKTIIRFCLILTGLAALTLGVLGAILPVLPATPFLLLALFCFAKSSEKLNTWFRGTWLYKKYLIEYVRTKTLTRRQKVSIQLCAGTMMMVSFFLIESGIMKALLVICFLIHNWIFIFKIKTHKPDSSQESKAPETEDKSERSASSGKES